MTANAIVTPHDTPPAAGEATQIAPGVLWVRLPLPMALDHVNIYAFDDGDAGWTIVDTGMDSRRTRALWQTLIDGPLGGRRVHQVVVTHHHPDHVGLAGWFVAQGARLMMPRTGWLLTRMLTLDEQPSLSPEAAAFYHRAGMPPAMLAERRTQRPFNFCDCVAPLPQGYHRLQEGDMVTFGGRRWDVRMGHGHAPEHATFWSRDDDLVIGGDQLLLSISPNLGVYPTEPAADPVGEWLRSCAAFQPFADETHLVLGGHKLPYRGLPRRLDQMMLNHEEALDRLHAGLGRPRSAVECFPLLFKRSIGPAEYGLALAEAVAHLNHLSQTGRAIETVTPDGVARYTRA